MLRLEKEDETFGIVVADIDDFKKINDLYGHDCGDFVLKEIAEICISKLDENINIYRFGGEEILFIYKDKHIKLLLQLLLPHNSRIKTAEI